MPSPELDNRYQTAVLWPFLGYDRYGAPRVSTPVEVRVRWSDTKSEALDADGNTVSVDASAVVDRDVEIGSEMWLGSLDDWYGTGSAGGGNSGSGLHEVKTYNATPDLKNRFSQRVVGLMRKSNKSPAAV